MSTLSVLATAAALTVFASQPVAAASSCAALPTGQGSAKTSFAVSTAGSYRVWAHIYAPQATGSMLSMQVDSRCPLTIGGGSLPANAFTWVDYADSDGSAPVTVNLAAGTHTLTIATSVAGVGVDRVFLAIGSCVPTGNGSNCKTATTNMNAATPSRSGQAPTESSGHTAPVRKKLSAVKLTAYVGAATILFVGGAVILVRYGWGEKLLRRLLDLYSRLSPALTRLLPSRFAKPQEPIESQAPGVVIRSFGQVQTGILSGIKAKLIFIACFGIAGGAITFIALAAAAPYVDVNPTTAILSGLAKVVPNNHAIDGYMVQFGTSTTSGTASSNSGGKSGSVSRGTPGPGGSSSNNPLSGLPHIAWEGGPTYYNQFPQAVAAGWNKQSFFPIAIWFDNLTTTAQMKTAKTYGINTWVGMDAATDYGLFSGTGTYELTPLNNRPTDSPASPGDFLADEPDGRGATLSDDLATIQGLESSSGNDGRFKQFNFTQIVVGNYGSSNNSISAQMVDSYAGPVSVDNYWYTMPDCTGSPSFQYSLIPIGSAHCRTASSYGTVVRELRQRNVEGGGPLKPIWNYVEDLTGAPDSSHFYADISPGQLEGAVMDSVINEARGIFYFDGALGGTCTSGSAGEVLATVIAGSLPCAQPQMNAMKEVDGVIQNLAPVINTQSYQYTFGSNLDTMLKWYNGSVYVFAMINGNASSNPGSRTFKLPQGLANVSNVTVLNENRTIPVTKGVFTDNFANEYTYHIYKITP